MPRLAANLTMLFNEVDFLDRFDAAAQAGFSGVEFLFPYDYPVAELRTRLQANGLTQVLFNLPPGNWSAGERGLAALPGRQAEFRDSVRQALEYAAALGCRTLHCMAGIPGPEVPFATAAAVYAANLAWAAEQAHGAGVKLAIEPINHRDMPGYHLHTLAQGAAIVTAIGPDRLGLQFDIYHCQVTEGDITRRIEAHLPIIAHMQLADVPDRHEPGTGEIGWDHLFRHIDALGYGGWIGCEYRPAKGTVAGLAWRRRYGV
ncbi:putative hydroxypyruvate isomerase [Rhodovastum atsumiense]|uniref:Hydroxypyruvate isomerase family protein n=1 Tax=Rhodovastum atsumiense TaxID=504468 RepID=A0A5M6IQQ2_9PROT|nr:2-oxo-tetronate isomerase [Rhodovastum atsumiense]KAA5610551.1 hydroxypyruvate isomerase family protein [Rhodovastum atsumiense]CAH2604995.1 putative hydroxypyruvate isomerase [Rhodovastum atsumiense]